MTGITRLCRLDFDIVPATFLVLDKYKATADTGKAVSTPLLSLQVFNSPTRLRPYDHSHGIACHSGPINRVRYYRLPQSQVL